MTITDGSWFEMLAGFFKHTHDIITMVPLLHGQPAYITCSLEVMKQLLGNEGQRHLPKPQSFTEPFLYVLFSPIILSYFWSWYSLLNCIEAVGQERIFIERRYVETTSEDHGSCVHNKNVSPFSLSVHSGR